MGCNYHNYQHTFITVFIIIHYQPPYYPRCHYKYLYQLHHHNILTRGQAAQRRIFQQRPGSARAQPPAGGVQRPRWDKYLCIPMGDNLHWLAALGTTVKCVSETMLYSLHFQRGGIICPPPLSQMWSWKPLSIRVKCIRVLGHNTNTSRQRFKINMQKNSANNSLPPICSRLPA